MERRWGRDPNWNCCRDITFWIKMGSIDLGRDPWCHRNRATAENKITIFLKLKIKNIKTLTTEEDAHSLVD
jgi:hypothetical protein